MNTMEYKGFKAQIMEAPRLTGDHVHGLPPGVPLDIYPVDAFIKPQENWMTGPGSFVVPVKPDKGLWFDWRGNSSINTAVIPTVKGCNPITGMQTSGFHLEKYETKCPKHGCDFLAERFCPECNYKWAPQGYVSSPNTLWWDGFRSDDGTVRQFFFSEDELRDVASGLIGKENTVSAFGFAFYSPKERRQEPSQGFQTIHLVDAGPYYSYECTACKPEAYSAMTDIKSSYYSSMDSPSAAVASSSSIISSGTIQTARSRAISPKNDPIGTGAVRSRAIPPKNVSIGAGAKISQGLNPDPYTLDTWQETPDAVMTLYFVFQEMFNDIKAGGLKNLEGHSEGFLANCPVG